MNVTLHHGDCLDILPTLKAGSVDAVITDPPYPCIKRSYGYWTVEEWWELIVEGVIPEIRRILKLTGSAVFILQPNSKHIGQMRGWLWEFMAWVCREWNMVQDVWWWNYTMIPSGAATRCQMLRSSVKSCVWAGIPNCYKNQDAVLWAESHRNAAERAGARYENKTRPSGHSDNRARIYNAATKRGGVTPFNLLPICHNGNKDRAKRSHGAGTPLKLADWWTRYIVPSGGTICDPFVGSGTMGVAAVEHGHNFIGIDKHDIEIAKVRIAKAQAEMVQLQLA